MILFIIDRICLSHLNNANPRSISRSLIRTRHSLRLWRVSQRRTTLCRKDWWREHSTLQQIGYCSEMENISAYELSPFSTLLNIIKHECVEKPEVYTTLLAVLSDFEPEEEKVRARTHHYIKLLLADHPVLAACLINYLPENSNGATEINTTGSYLPRTKRRKKTMFKKFYKRRCPLHCSLLQTLPLKDSLQKMDTKLEERASQDRTSQNEKTNKTFASQTETVESSSYVSMENHQNTTNQQLQTTTISTETEIHVSEARSLHPPPHFSNPVDQVCSPTFSMLNTHVVSYGDSAMYADNFRSPNMQFFNVRNHKNLLCMGNSRVNSAKMQHMIPLNSQLGPGGECYLNNSQTYLDHRQSFLGYSSYFDNSVSMEGSKLPHFYNRMSYPLLDEQWPSSSIFDINISSVYKQPGLMGEPEVLGYHHNTPVYMRASNNLSSFPYTHQMSIRTEHASIPIIPGDKQGALIHNKTYEKDESNINNCVTAVTGQLSPRRREFRIKVKNNGPSCILDHAKNPSIINQLSLAGSVASGNSYMDDCLLNSQSCITNIQKGLNSLGYEIKTSSKSVYKMKSSNSYADHTCNDSPTPLPSLMNTYFSSYVPLKVPMSKNQEVRKRLRLIPQSKSLQ